MKKILFIACFIFAQIYGMNGMNGENTFFQTFAAKEAQRFKMKVGVFLLLIQDNQILLLRRAQTGIDDGCYVVPMGGVDGKETLTTACIREAYEEANIIIKPEDMHVCHVMHRFHPMLDGFSFEQMDVFFCVSRFEGTIQNNEPHKCDELAFYPLDNLPDNVVPFIRSAINAYRSHIFFSEFGWDTAYDHGYKKQ